MQFLINQTVLTDFNYLIKLIIFKNIYYYYYYYCIFIHLNLIVWLFFFFYAVKNKLLKTDSRTANSTSRIPLISTSFEAAFPWQTSVKRAIKIYQEYVRTVSQKQIPASFIILHRWLGSARRDPGTPETCWNLCIWTGPYNLSCAKLNGLPLWFN